MKKILKITFVLLFLALSFLTVQQQVLADEANGVALPAPELYAPFDKATSEKSKPLFTWEHFPEADRYRWEILEKDTGVTIKKAYYDASTRCSGDTCSIPCPVELTNGAYKWHVVAIDDDGGYQLGTWSTYNVLYIGTEVYPRPALRSPGADAIVYGGRPTFKWYPVVGDDITYAAIELTDVNGDLVGLWNAAVDNDTCPTYCEYRIPLNLSLVPNGNDGFGDYNWRVQVMNADKSAVSPYSVQRTFTYTQLDRVTLLSPADGTLTAESSPTMEWTPVTGATYYIFNVRGLDDSILTWDLVPATACDATTCSAEPSVTLPSGDWQWHIRSKNGTNYGRWTSYWDISIAAVAAPVLVSPADGAAVHDSQPDLVWERAEGATNYVVEVTDPSDALVGSWDYGDNYCGTSTCTFTVPTSLGSTFGTYHWRVKGQDGGQDGIWSETRSFTYTGLGTVTLVSPENPTTIGDSTPVLTWTTVEGAGTYNLHVMYASNSVTLVQDQIPAADCDTETNTCTAVPSMPLQPDGEWKWQVRAENGTNYGAWSSTWYITTNTSSGTEYDFEFDDGVDPTTTYGWVENNDTWYVWSTGSGYYRGNEYEGADGGFLATTYYDLALTDAIFESRIQANGTDAAIGFTLIFRGSFDGSDNFDDGYMVSVMEGSTGILCRFWQVENGSPIEPLGEVVWEGDGIGEIPTVAFEWHVYKLELFGNTMTFSIDGNDVHTLSGLDPVLGSGRFGMDLESAAEDHNLYILSDWVHITDMSMP